MPTMLQRQKVYGKPVEGQGGRLFTLSYRQWRQARGNALLANNFRKQNQMGYRRLLRYQGLISIA